MELAVHGDLLDYIRSVKAVDEKQACRWFHHLVEGIEYCHKKDVYHRDIKCENLLLGEGYVLKITDFGFARRRDTATADSQTSKENILSKTYCGSYAYAPPEILRGQPYDMRMIDIWSMGVVLFTMVSGRLPFKDSDHKLLLEQVDRPVVYSRSRPPSEKLKILLDQIFRPVQSRIYIPDIKRDRWYREKYSKNMIQVDMPEARLAYHQNGEREPKSLHVLDKSYDVEKDSSKIKDRSSSGCWRNNSSRGNKY